MVQPATASFWSGFRWADLIAIVGALAWLPHLIRYFRRPRVTIVPGGLEIGFTGLGPILNPSLAFRTERVDALVTAISFDVQHQRGQRGDFRGVALAETPGFTQSSSGEAAIHQRNAATVAVVLSPTTLQERKVICQEAGHLSGYEPLIAAYQTAVRRVRRDDAKEWQLAAFETPEAHALRSFWLGEFFWQPGTYAVTCRVTVAELSEPATCQFSFTLHEEQVRLLRGKEQGLDLELIRVAAEQAEPGKQSTPIRYQWLYPQTRR